MKIKNTRKLIGLILLAMVSGLNAGTPETAEIREPEAIKVVKPVVPYELGRQGVSGRVDVSFKLDNEGRLQDIRIEGATHDAYAKSVINALRRWRYEQPENANVRYIMPVLFN